MTAADRAGRAPGADAAAGRRGGAGFCGAEAFGSGLCGAGSRSSGALRAGTFRKGPRALRRTLLAGVSLLGLAALAVPFPSGPAQAQSFGGTGGSASGSDGGTGGGYGQDGGAGGLGGGGGGGPGGLSGPTSGGNSIGGGAPGGGGGASFWILGVGLNTSIGFSGGDGTDGGSGGTSVAGGGGGAGGYGVYGLAPISVTLNGSDVFSGGDGGKGGSGSYGPSATFQADGGDGGGGIYFTKASTLTNSATLVGGNGGDGGSTTTTGRGGNGGNGGDGVLAPSGLTLTNSGSIAGGNGGKGGASAGEAGTNGAGGVGVNGANMDITTSGLISGGLAGDGVTRADAITFTGGANTLTLQTGWGLTGNLGVNGAGTSLTFKLDGIDADVSNAITGAGGIVVDVPGQVLTLSGTNTYSGGTTLKAGTLSVASDAALGSSVNLTMGAPVGGVTDLSGAVSGLDAAIASYAQAPTPANAAALASAQTAYDTALADGRSAGTVPTLQITGPTVLDGSTDARLTIHPGEAAAVRLEGDGAGLTMSNYSGSLGAVIGLAPGAVLDLGRGEGNTAGYTFSGNSAGDGGVIYSERATVSITGATFTGNIATYVGGAIANAGGTLAMTDVSFTGNSASSGGAILSVNGSVAITRGMFTDNSAGQLGGALSLDSGAVVVADSSFTGNTAGLRGGAIAATGADLALITSANTTSLFSGNLAAGSASSIHLSPIAIPTGPTPVDPLEYFPSALSVVTDAGGLLDMRDPMGGDSAASTQTIAKSGAGTWALGGSNVFTADATGGTTFTVSDGRLYLYGAGEVANPNVNDANARVAAGAVQLDGTGSAFTVGGTATLVAGGANAITTDGTIVFKDGATVRGGNADTAMGGADPAFMEKGGATSLTLTATSGITLEGNLNAAALGAGDTFTLAGDLGGAAGSLTKLGAGTVALTGANTYEGGTTIAAGTLALSGAGTLATTGAVALTGSTSVFDLSGADGDRTIGDLSGVAGSTVKLGTNGLATGTANDITFAGAFDGTGTLTKKGTGALLLTGDSSGFAGATTVSAGTLLVGDDTGGALGGTVQVAAGATLGGSGTIGGATTIEGTLAAGNSPGTLTFQDDLTLKAGSTSLFELNAPGVTGGASNDLVQVDGTLTLGGTLDANVGAAGYYTLFTYGSLASGSSFDTTTVTGTGGFDVQKSVVGYGGGTDSAVTLLAAGAGQTVQFWDGAQLTGNGTVEGGTGIWNAANSNWTGAPGDAGINAPWIGSVAVFMGTAGTVTVEGTQAFDTLQFKTDGYELTGGTLALAPASGSFGTVSTDAGVTATIGAVIADGTGASGLRKTGAGTLVLSGINTYSGGTEIAGGTLSISADANLGDAAGGLTLDGGTLRNTAAFTSARSVTLGSGNGAFETQADLALSGVVGGSGGLLKTGAGVLTLSGTNTYQGGTAIEAGTLSVSADANLGDAAGGLTLDGGTLRNTAAFTSARSVTLGSGNGAFETQADLALTGIVGGSGGLLKTGAGVLTLSGTNTYQGGTAIEAGTLSVSADANLGDASGGLTLDGGTLRNTAAFTSARSVTLGSGNGAFETQADLALMGIVGGSGGLLKTGAGVLMLSGTNTYQGGTTIEAGTLSISADANLGDAAGGLTLAGGTLGTTASFSSARTVTVDGAGGFDVAAGTQFGLSGAISGTGTLTKLGAGTLALSGPSALDWSVDAGRLAADISLFAGDVAIAGGATFELTATAASGYGGTLSGSGTFEKLGAGTLVYVGSSGGFAGTTSVAAGQLAVTGTLGGTVEVLSGATLSGTGTIGALNAGAGSTVTPGNSIGTLAVAGNATFGTGSTYAVELGGGQSDLLAVGGTATIASGTTLVVDAQQPYSLGEHYTLLSTIGLSGSFGTVVGDVGAVSAFYSAEVVYDYAGGNVFLDVAQTRAFASAAVTPNQASTARALNSLTLGNPLYDAVAWLPSDAAARSAFDQLSGQIGASALGLFVEQGGMIRNAMIDRLRAAQGSVGGSSAPVMAYAAASGPGATEAGKALQAVAAPATTAGPALWATGFGNWTTMDATFNAAGLSASSGGMLIGFDGALDGGWRIGAVGGYGFTAFSLNGLASSGNSDNWHAGLYGGRQWGALALRTGLAYTWQDVSTTRTVSFPGFAEQLRASYTAGLFQAFGEAGYRIDGPIAAFEPFANLAYASLSTGDYAETGGGAALISGGNAMATSFTTLGVRIEKRFALGGVGTTVRGTVGWRHAFGDITPAATQAFLGSDPFTITGLPIAQDALVLDAGLDFALTQSATLGLAYVGQIGGGTSQNGLNAALKVSF